MRWRWKRDLLAGSWPFYAVWPVNSDRLLCFSGMLIGDMEGPSGWLERFRRVAKPRALQKWVKSNKGPEQTSENARSSDRAQAMYARGQMQVLPPFAADKKKSGQL